MVLQADSAAPKRFRWVERRGKRVTKGAAATLNPRAAVPAEFVAQIEIEFRIEGGRIILVVTGVRPRCKGIQAGQLRALLGSIQADDPVTALVKRLAHRFWQKPDFQRLMASISQVVVRRLIAIGVDADKAPVFIIAITQF